MLSHNRYAGIDSAYISIVRKKAKELTRHRLFSINDIEDLEQELMLGLLITVSSYNPKKKYGFAKTVVHRHARDLVRRASSKKRGGDCFFYSLYSPLPNSDEEILLIDAIPSGATFYDHSGQQLPQEQIEREIDRQRAIKRMPPTLGELCELLHTKTISEVVKITGMSQAAVYRAIGRIKEAFRSLEIENFA